MKCLNCGAELNDEIKFCTNCGVEVNNDSNNINNELGEKEEFAVKNEENVANNVVNNVVGPDIKPLDITNINSQNVMHDITNISNNDNTESNKKKSNKKFIIIIVIIVLLLVITGGLLYVLKPAKKSAKGVFVDSFKSVTSSIFKDNDVKKQSVNQTIKYNISGAGVESFSEIFNNIVLKDNTSVDRDLKNIEEELIVNYKNNDLFGVGIYGRENSLYLGIDGLYDKYIKLPITDSEYNSIFNSDKKNSKAIKETLDDAFEKSLDDKYFTKSSKKLTVDDKNKKFNAYTLTIDNSNIKKITKSFINSLANNDSFISMLGADKNTIKAYINMIDYNSISLDNPFEITIYTEGNKDVYKGIEFSTKVEGNVMSVRYMDIDKENAELVFDMGITSFSMKINSVGDDTKNKTTATIDMGIMKMSMIADTIISNKVEFKSIDTNKVVDFDSFIETGLYDIINNVITNEKIIEFITDVTDNFGMNGDISDLSSLDYSSLY